MVDIEAEKKLIWEASAPIVKQLDQIYGRMQSVREVDSLISLFADTFQLPMAWSPIIHSSFYGGGVFTGNTWLKFVTWNLRKTPTPDEPKGAEFFSIMFEPHLKEQVWEELKKRGIPHTRHHPNTFIDRDDEEKEWVQSTTIDDFSDGGFSGSTKVNVNLCWYTPSAFSMTTTPYARTVPQHREMLKHKLEERSGGPLGIQHVSEVSIGTPDFEGSKERWQRFLDPLEPVRDGVWQVGDGPVLRLIPHGEHGILSISFKVRSREKAQRFLEEKGLLGNVSRDALKLVCNNLDIRLIE